MTGSLDVYAFELHGPAGALSAGRRAVLSGLAPGGVRAVTIEQRRADGIWAAVVTVPVGADGSFRAAVVPTGPASTARSRPARRACRCGSRSARGSTRGCSGSAGGRTADPRDRPARAGGGTGRAAALLARALPLAPGRPRACRPPLAGVVRRQPAAPLRGSHRAAGRGVAATGRRSGRAATWARAPAPAPDAARRRTPHGPAPGARGAPLSAPRSSLSSGADRGRYGAGAGSDGVASDAIRQPLSVRWSSTRVLRRRLALGGGPDLGDRRLAPDGDLADDQPRLAHVPETLLERDLAREADLLEIGDQRRREQPVAQRLVVLGRRRPAEGGEGRAHLLLGGRLALPAARERDRERGERPPPPHPPSRSSGVPPTAAA